MQKRLLFTITFIIQVFISKAQFNSLFEEEGDSVRNTMGAYFDYAISSTSVCNSFVNAYINDQFIDEELKNDVYAKLQDENTIGSNLIAGIFYKNKSKKLFGIISPEVWIALNHRSYFNAVFPRDLFQLYFSGNKMYEGKEADISNFDSRLIQYQQLQFGLAKSFETEKIIYKAGLGLSLLNGQNAVMINTGRGKLYTAEGGEYVKLDMELDAKLSDSSSKKFGSSNGAGFSADFFFSVKTKTDWTFSVSAVDIGAISWNDKSTYMKVDTNYYFDGVEVLNLLDTVYLEIKSDGEFREGFFKEKTTRSFTTSLPAAFKLSVDKLMNNKKLIVSLAAEEHLNDEFELLLSASASFFFSKKLYAGINLSNGGYGNFGAGLQAGIAFSKGFVLTTGSNSVITLIASKKPTGQGGFICLTKKF